MGKLKMLFLDDRTKRIHAALRQYSEVYEVTICTNVLECLRLLAREDYDWISLDHDLGGEDFVDPDSKTCGMEIVRYLEKTDWPMNKKKPMVILHSSNVFAAEMMRVRLSMLEFPVALVRPFEYV